MSKKEQGDLMKQHADGKSEIERRTSQRTVCTSHTEERHAQKKQYFDSRSASADVIHNGLDDKKP